MPEIRFHEVGFVTVIVAIVLAYALLVPDSAVIAAAGGMLKATGVAAIVAAVAVHAPRFSSGFMFLTVVTSPVLGMRIEEMAPSQQALSRYYLAMCAIIVVGAIVELVHFARTHRPKRKPGDDCPFIREQ